jgi:hypothetical protein
MSVDDDRERINKVLSTYKLDKLRTAAIGKEWQQKFGLSEAIPVTLVLSSGSVRVTHDAVLPDAVAYLEADLNALQTGTPVGK